MRLFYWLPANDHDLINIQQYGGVKLMFSISLSVDGTIKLANSLQHIDTTHTFYETVEECLAQNHMVGLFEINPQYIKFYLSDIEWTNLSH